MKATAFPSRATSVHHSNTTSTFATSPARTRSSLVVSGHRRRSHRETRKLKKNPPLLFFVVVSLAFLESVPVFFFSRRRFSYFLPAVSAVLARSTTTTSATSVGDPLTKKKKKSPNQRTAKTESSAFVTSSSMASKEKQLATGECPLGTSTTTIDRRISSKITAAAASSAASAAAKANGNNPAAVANGSGSTTRLRTRGTTLKHRDPIYVWSSLVAGVGSGALASILCAPLDLVRTRLQVWGDVAGTGRGLHSRDIPGMLRDIVRREGWRGCFRGLGATLMTVPGFWGVYFPLYEEFKYHFSSRYPLINPAWVHMGSAVLSGAVSDVVCNPMFVVRTRLQTEALHAMMEAQNQQQHGRAVLTKPKTIVQTARALYAEGGPLIFWRGMTANLLGLSHVAIQFPVYEHLKRKLKSRRGDGESCTAVDLLFASGLSKMTACVLTYPHEVIRSRMMDARTAAGFFESCRRIWVAEGVLGFYAGLPVSLVRVIPNTCITFVTYELLLRMAKRNIIAQQQQSQRQGHQS